MSRKKEILLLIFLTIIGGFFRIVDIASNPVSLNIDEVSIGYNAYSILHTARDEYGTFLPLSFKSVGDFKPPILIYATVPSVALFGLNEFGVRFPNALISTLSIPLTYLLFLKLMGRKKIALIAMILLTISPWHIYYSRYAIESMLATTFLIAGVISLLFINEGKKWAPFGTAFFLILSMYTYHAHRLFVPLFLLSYVFLNWRDILGNKKPYILFVVLSCLFIAPLLYTTVFGNDASRAQATFITKDIEYQRTVTVEQINQNLYLINSTFDSDQFLLLFYWVRKYLNYFHPYFLFFNGLNMTIEGSLGVGVMYLFELPFILFGIWYLIDNRARNSKLVWFWILLGLFPASLTQNEQHSLRTLLIMPMVVLVSGVGATVLLEKYQKNTNYLRKLLFGFVFGLIVIWNMTYAYLIFSHHLAKQRGENFMEGTKQTVLYALAHKNEYKEIVFDPVRGVDGPYVVSIPHMYVLFYSHYDPLLYQTETKRVGKDTYGFDKFSFRAIDWSKDRESKGVLFIGSPWSIPEKDLKPNELLSKVYMSNGKLAFFVVTPK
jgi:4-amino-4-deoxy-L-arabinose transferase-like glycosyltransferase